MRYPSLFIAGVRAISHTGAAPARKVSYEPPLGDMVISRVPNLLLGACHCPEIEGAEKEDDILMGDHPANFQVGFQSLGRGSFLSAARIISMGTGPWRRIWSWKSRRDRVPVASGFSGPGVVSSRCKA